MRPSGLLMSLLAVAALASAAGFPRDAGAEDRPGTATPAPAPPKPGAATPAPTPPAAPLPAPPVARNPDEARALELLEQLQAGQGDRGQLLDALVAVAPRAVPLVAAFLGRPRATSVEERALILRASGASVPDKTGKFETPARQASQQAQADDDLDWLAALTKLDLAALAATATQVDAGIVGTAGVAGTRDAAVAPIVPSAAGLGEIYADVAAIRALAATRRDDAARAILELGFGADTMIYRDECGRRLRAMMPSSLPALHVASQSTDKARARYATYQLERVDRQEPGKAWTATANDEDLRIELLAAFGSARHREAVSTVLRAVDNDAPRVRRAAREAWMSYVAGKAPRAAPKRKLVLPGGKLADKETPLWLTWRELAVIELKRTAEEVLGSVFAEADDRKLDPVALSNELFAHYDTVRAQRDGALFAEAKAIAARGDLVAAGAALDRLLAENPELGERAQAAPIYLALARAHEQAKAWSAAAAAFGKAYGVAPEGADAIDAQAGREMALGRALEAEGKDGGANFRRAVALKPDYEPARSAAANAAPPGSSGSWLLWAAGAGAAAAVAFLVVGLRRRRAAT